MAELLGYCLPLSAVSFEVVADFRWGLGTAGVKHSPAETILHPYEIPAPPLIHPINKDTLEHAAGAPPKRTVEAHRSTWLDHRAFSPEEFPSERLVSAWCSLIFHSLGELAEGVSHGLRMVKEVDLVVMWSSLSIYPFQGNGGQADSAAFLSGCSEGIGTLAERLGRTEELEEVWGLVGGGSDENAKADTTRSDDAEAAKSIDAKVSRIVEDDEHGLFAIDSWKKSVMKDLSIQVTPMTGMIVADLHRENIKVRQIRLEQARGPTGGQPARNNEC
ncbi:hypothetical protein HOY80DRAFT_1047045 [Tuber brumale]|nr:hypothetical protein HOY80DRAFT_1047045 [Tuber brumale]